MRGAATPASMPSCPPSSPRGFPSAASPASFGATATLAGFFRFGIRGVGAGGGRRGQPAPLGPEDAAATGPATSPCAQPSHRRGHCRPARQGEEGAGGSPSCAAVEPSEGGPRRRPRSPLRVADLGVAGELVATPLRSAPPPLSSSEKLTGG
ncbi:Os02g0108000 [Oryza sativa Japonica Group]|uniref:Os02g0108000 protein n=3 Tax=Oryza sativa TaxID=4530 RepID=B7EBH6_ORYSJ|nr:protein capicua homolog [Oryza sativa Japonica Group]EEC72322.1 hypothetical protein OsI_05519 [Oryza sativa Indica Group]KAB8085496.1 hypothetical protein EE612_008344 [Oryza sativa]EEE56152.1 hypothetical protein OsJ_05043 [Oryza sativa Japonica Group]BAG89723.1 unnamed protein product [Oryza sativa Japonica Group]BAS76587.1 Os02g0108000 [Oryza sativa Japonica Group]